MIRLKKYISTSTAVIAVILVGFASIIGLFLYSDLQNKKLEKKKAEALAMVELWGTLQKTTTALLIADDLAQALRHWQETIAAFDSRLNAFIQSGIIQDQMHSDAEFAEKIEETENLWRILKPRIEYARPQLAEYVAQGQQEATEYRRSLLHELLFQMEQRDRRTDYMILFDLTYDIEYMVSSLNNYFVSVLAATVQMISDKIDKKSQRIRRIVTLAAVLIVTITVLVMILNQKALRGSEAQLRFLSSQLILAEEKERKRISHELHDEVGQALTAIKFGIENSLNMMAGDNPRESKKILQDLVSIIQNAVVEARRISISLRPAIIDQLGIIATISWYCRGYRKIYSGLQIQQQFDLEETRVPDPLKIVIYRVLQESLTNIAKHSNAQAVQISLADTNGGIQLKVEDNGPGFDVTDIKLNQETGSGFGLVSMRERVELSGGVFTIITKKGEGTTIQAFWPV